MKPPRLAAAVLYARTVPRYGTGRRRAAAVARVARRRHAARGSVLGAYSPPPPPPTQAFSPMWWGGLDYLSRTCAPLRCTPRTLRTLPTARLYCSLLACTAALLRALRRACRAALRASATPLLPAPRRRSRASLTASLPALLFTSPARCAFALSLTFFLTSLLLHPPSLPLTSAALRHTHQTVGWWRRWAVIRGRDGHDRKPVNERSPGATTTAG